MITQLQLLDEDHMALMETFEGKIQQCNEYFCIDDPEHFGSWSDSEHSIFSKIMRHARKIGQSRSEITLSLKTQLPEKSQEQISRYENWYNAMKQIQRKRKEIADHYNQNRTDKISDALKSATKLKMELHERRLQDGENKKREEYRSALHEK